MTMALVKYTARRGKTLETIRRDVIGHTPDDPEQFYDELARIIGPDVISEIEDRRKRKQDAQTSYAAPYNMPIEQKAEKNAL